MRFRNLISPECQPTSSLSPAKSGERVALAAQPLHEAPHLRRLSLRPPWQSAWPDAGNHVTALENRSQRRSKGTTASRRKQHNARRPRHHQASSLQCALGPFSKPRQFLWHTRDERNRAPPSDGFKSNRGIKQMAHATGLLGPLPVHHCMVGISGART